jgi:hypothetical protein
MYNIYIKPHIKKTFKEIPSFERFLGNNSFNISTAYVAVRRRRSGPNCQRQIAS